MIKAFDLRSDVHLHVWVRIPLLANNFFLFNDLEACLVYAQVRSGSFFSKFAYTSYNDLIKKSLGELRQDIPAYTKERLAYKVIKGTRGSFNIVRCNLNNR